MATKSKWSDRVTNIKITVEDMETLSELADSPYYKAMLRVALKLTNLWKDQSFKLDEMDPQFALKHQRFVERSIGIKMLLRFIEESRKKADKEDEE